MAIPLVAQLQGKGTQLPLLRGASKTPCVSRCEWKVKLAAAGVLAGYDSQTPVTLVLTIGRLASSPIIRSISSGSASGSTNDQAGKQHCQVGLAEEATKVSFP